MSQIPFFCGKLEISSLHSFHERELTQIPKNREVAGVISEACADLL